MRAVPIHTCGGQPMKFDNLSGQRWQQNCYPGRMENMTGLEI